MKLEITQEATMEDITEVFGGEIPDHYGDAYIELRTRNKMIFVAKRDGKAVGFLIYSIWWGSCPFVETAKIIPELRRRGIATRLLKELAKKLSSEGFDKIISSTKATNPIGLGFHDMNGFKKLGKLPMPRGDELFYTIDIDKVLNK